MDDFFMMKTHFFELRWPSAAKPARTRLTFTARWLGLSSWQRASQRKPDQTLTINWSDGSFLNLQYLQRPLGEVRSQIASLLSSLQTESVGRRMRLFGSEPGTSVNEAQNMFVIMQMTPSLTLDGPLARSFSPNQRSEYRLLLQPDGFMVSPEHEGVFL